MYQGNRGIENKSDQICRFKERMSDFSKTETVIV